jgi:hypothetical protein
MTHSLASDEARGITNQAINVLEGHGRRGVKRDGWKIQTAGSMTARTGRRSRPGTGGCAVVMTRYAGVP